VTDDALVIPRAPSDSSVAAPVGRPSVSAIMATVRRRGC
jgi:hypothetical protein